MAFSFNWKPQKIPTQLKGTATLPEVEQPFDFTQYFTNLVNREEMDGYHPAGNFSVPNQQHGGNAPVNYNGYQPTTPLTEDDIVSQNLNERQVGNVDDMANWIQQGGTPVADAQAAAAQQAEQEAVAKQQQVDDIKSQIQALEERIKTNKAKLKNWIGKAGEIAALDARKINNNDATSIWRWKNSSQNTNNDLERVQAEKDAAKEKALQNLKYKIDAQLKPMDIGMGTTENDVKTWTNTLADLEEQGLSGDVGEAYMNKIWDMQSKLKNSKLPSNVAAQLTSNFGTMMDNFDKIEAHGGYGKNREKYLADIDANWEEIKNLYESNGAEVPLEVRKAYIEARNKFNKKKTTPRSGAPKV